MMTLSTRIYSLAQAYVPMGTSDASEAEFGDMNGVLKGYNAGRS